MTPRPIYPHNTTEASLLGQRTDNTLKHTAALNHIQPKVIQQKQQNINKQHLHQLHTNSLQS